MTNQAQQLVRQRVEEPTLAAGRLPALHLRSRHPPCAAWPPSLVSPSEAPVGPCRMHLHTRGTEDLLIMKCPGPYFSISLECFYKLS